MGINMNEKLGILYQKENELLHLEIEIYSNEISKMVE